MYCPKCGNDSPEGNRFCKACGANLQIVSDAMEGKHAPLVLGQLGIDVEKIRRSAARHLANGLRYPKAAEDAQPSDHTTATSERQQRREAKRQRDRQPRPKEWLRYSWQHNLRDGLMSLFGGAGFGAVLYFVSRTLSEMGVLSRLESESHVHGLEMMIRLVWLFAAIPMVKGISQILYAAFFAESIATLSDRFIPKSQLGQIEAPQKSYISSVPPASVTEQTTNILEKDEGLLLRQEAERVTQ